MIAESAPEGTRLDEYIYTPKRIARWLRDWETLKALAANQRTARGLLVPGATPEEPKLSAQPGYHSDVHAFSDIVADLERARAQALDGLSLEWYVVEAQMHGWSLNRFAEKAHIGDERCWRAFNVACELMAVYLGWVKE